MTKVLYFHGFASSPNSEKVRVLRAILAPDVELVTPDLIPSFVGIDDETLPFERVEAVWQRWRPHAAPGSRFVAVPGGNHSLLSSVVDIAKEIQTRCV